MSFKLALAQINVLVGDVAGNTQKVITLAHEARDRWQADAILFPELTLTGYPPEDLLLRPEMDERIGAALEQLCRDISGIAVILGFPWCEEGKRYNSAGVIHEGRLLGRYDKALLPNYSVFDEKRYFDPGHQPCVVELAGVRVGITICEDIWFAAPAALACRAGAELLVNLNASPFHRGKSTERATMVARRIKENHVPVVYLNLVGGQDELVFDGGSFVMDNEARPVQRLPQFDECLSLAAFAKTHGFLQPLPAADQCSELTELAAIYAALVLGVRDYVRKNGFSGAVLGLSGGIDSALTLCLAVDALGAGQVEAVSMPSRYTADMSNEDAWLQAQSMGVRYRSIPIETAFVAFLQLLDAEFAGLPADVTEENIQARCRGIVLMAISNKTGKILLTTGNKSEMSVGYATLYGDMAGGFAPLKDVPKLLVYQLAEYRNHLAPVIPQRVIDRPPSAELRPDQRDSDSLPDYSVLDSILELYVELDFSRERIIADGFDAQTVQRVCRLVDRNEYKRRQSPPGVRITRRAFGRDRRYPLTHGF